MKKILLSCVCCFVLSPLGSAFAEGALSSEALQQKIKLRDLAIIELLERVDALEKRVGLESSRPDATQESRQEASTHNANAAPGAVVVEEGDAERALERALTIEGVLLLPFGTAEIDTSIGYIRQEYSTANFFQQDSQIFPSETEVNSDIVTGRLGLRLGLPWSSQLELSQPYSIRKTEVISRVNFEARSVSSEDAVKRRGDARLGLAKTVVRERLWVPDIIARASWDTRSGEGTGFDEIIGSLSATKRHDPVTLISSLSYQHGMENEGITPGAAVSAGFGGLLGLSPETSLRVTVNGFYQQNTSVGGSAIPGSNRKLASLNIGGSVLLFPGSLLNLSLGIGLTRDADDFSLGMSLPIRF